MNEDHFLFHCVIITYMTLVRVMMGYMAPMRHFNSKQYLTNPQANVTSSEN